MTQTYNVGGCSGVDQHTITISLQKISANSCTGSVTR